MWRYYDRTESRIGYQLLLGGTKHFGWYERASRSGGSARRCDGWSGAAGRLAFAAASFDAVYTMETLLHAADPEAATR